MSDAESVARKIMKPILDCLPFEEDDMTLDIVVALQNARADGMREAARIVGRLSDEWAINWRMTSSAADVHLEVSCDAATAIATAILSAIGENRE